MGLANGISLGLPALAMSFLVFAQTTYEVQTISLGSPYSGESLVVYISGNFTIAANRADFREEIGTFNEKWSFKFDFEPLLEILDSTPVDETVRLSDQILPRRVEIRYLFFSLLEARRAYVRDNRIGQYLDSVQGGQFFEYAGGLGGDSGRVFLSQEGEKIIVLTEIQGM